MDTIEDQNIELYKYYHSLLKAVSRANMEAMATPVVFAILYAEPAEEGKTWFFCKAGLIGNYFRDKAEHFGEALMKGINQAVDECFETDPEGDYKVYHA